MNEHEIARLAAAMHQARPDWPTKQLVTMLGLPQLVDRPRRDVFVALAWVACETGTASPYRVLQSGPWWRAAAVEGGAQHREPYDASTFCGTCGEPRERCERKWAGDHEFEAVSHAKARKGAIDLTPVTAELKGHAHSHLTTTTQGES